MTVNNNREGKGTAVRLTECKLILENINAGLCSWAATHLFGHYTLQIDVKLRNCQEMLRKTDTSLKLLIK